MVVEQWVNLNLLACDDVLNLSELLESVIVSGQFDIFEAKAIANDVRVLGVGQNLIDFGRVQLNESD